MGFSSKWSVHVSEGTQDSGSGRYWRPEVSPPAEARERDKAEREATQEAKARERIEADKRKIIETLAKPRCKTGESKSVIRDTSGVRSRRFDVAFADLLEDGTVVPCQVSKANRNPPYDGYKLAEEESGAS